MSFHLATASMLGREHARLSKNNQDGVAARIEGEVAVVVVTDGCGSGASSEVGARLGARFLAQTLPRLIEQVGVGPRLAERACDALLAWVYEVVRPLDADGVQLPALVADQWLFTFLCAVMDSKRALIFGIGDGSWSADGEGRVLDPGPDNAPDYLAYRLVPAAFLAAPGLIARGRAGASEGDRCVGGAAAAKADPSFAVQVTESDRRSVARGLGQPVVHFFGEARQLALATDGLVGTTLESLSEDPLMWRNPVALERKLRVLSERERLLRDDTTVALLRRAA